MEDWNKIVKECGICGGKVKKTTTVVDGFELRGWKCESCGETILHPTDAFRLLKLRKIQKSGVSVKIGKLGDSLMVRIPKVISETYHLAKGKKVIMKPTAKEILLELP